MGSAAWRMVAGRQCVPGTKLKELLIVCSHLLAAALLGAGVLHTQAWAEARCVSSLLEGNESAGEGEDHQI